MRLNLVRSVFAGLRKRGFYSAHIFRISISEKYFQNLSQEANIRLLLQGINKRIKTLKSL